MTPLFADENVHISLVQTLRNFGHDVLTAHEAGRALSASLQLSWFLSNA
jgi:hypothetical protein